MDIRLFLIISAGQFLANMPCEASETFCREPFVWVKGCYKSLPSDALSRQTTINNNSPTACYRTCRDDAKFVALNIDKCVCLSTIPRVPFAAEGTCNEACKGDENVYCGGRNHAKIQAWSLYQIASEVSMKAMNIHPNATGCGYAWNNGKSYSLTSCTEHKHVLCVNRLMGCNNYYVGLLAWKEATLECKLYSAVLPDVMSCHTEASFDSYWLGIYRQKAYTENCGTTTSAHTVTSDEPFRTMSTGVSTDTQLITEISTDSTTTPTNRPSSSESTFTATSDEPFRTMSTRVSTDTQLTTEILTDSTTTPTNRPSSSESTFTATTDVKTLTKPSLGLSKIDATTSYGSTNTDKAVSSLRYVSTHVPRHSKFESRHTETITSRIKSHLTAGVASDSTHSPSSTSASPKFSIVLTTIRPSLPSTASILRKPESGKFEISGSSVRLENTDKMIIALSAIGTVVCTLLLAIVLLLCRISRILRKQGRCKRGDNLNVKHRDDQNATCFTDGISALPLRGGILSGQYRPPYPYNDFDIHNQGTQRSVRERINNTYKEWHDTGLNNVRTMRSGRDLNYSESWEGKIDNYSSSSSEEDERYHELIRT